MNDKSLRNMLVLKEQHDCRRGFEYAPYEIDLHKIIVSGHLPYILSLKLKSGKLVCDAMDRTCCSLIFVQNALFASHRQCH